MAISNTVNLTQAEYLTIRNNIIKSIENPFLSPDPNDGSIGSAEVHVVDGNPTIGYGWDLDVNSLNDTLQNFAAAGIQLTNGQRAALTAYKIMGSAVTLDANNLILIDMTGDALQTYRDGNGNFLVNASNELRRCPSSYNLSQI